jgi:hypothetical protein
VSDLQPVRRVESRSEYFECSCSDEAHVLRFSWHPWDEDKDLYTSVFLNQWHGFFWRCWLAVKYVFGYTCPFGHWDCWILRKEDALRLRGMIDDYIAQVGLVVEDGVVKEPRRVKP